MSLSRYTKIIGAPQIFPHQCVCGNARAEWYVDLKQKQTKRGVSSVFLCESCVRQIATENGFVSCDLADALNAQLEAVRYENKLLREGLNNANGTLATFRDVLRAANVAVPVEQEDSVNSDSDNRPSVERESGPEKSTDFGGPAHVSSDDGNLADELFSQI